MFKCIVVALKFTSAGHTALEKGVGLAREFGADLHIFHALDFLLGDLEKTDPQLISVIKDAERLFEMKAKPLLAGLKNYTFEYRPSDPALEVCRIAKGRNADLIILGCHQLVEKRCMGRVDYVGMTILEKAPCPVMLVPFCD